MPEYRATKIIKQRPGYILVTTSGTVDEVYEVIRSSGAWNVKRQESGGPFFLVSTETKRNDALRCIRDGIY